MLQMFVQRCRTDGHQKTAAARFYKPSSKAMQVTLCVHLLPKRVVTVFVNALQSRSLALTDRSTLHFSIPHVLHHDTCRSLSPLTFQKSGSCTTLISPFSTVAVINVAAAYRVASALYLRHPKSTSLVHRILTAHTSGCFSSFSRTI